MLNLKHRDIPEHCRTQDLIREYEELSERLEQIRTCFDLADEDSLIDALIYEENAVQCRLAALNQKARKMGAHVEHFERSHS